MLQDYCQVRVKSRCDVIVGDVGCGRSHAVFLIYHLKREGGQDSNDRITRATQNYNVPNNKNVPNKYLKTA